MSNEWFSATAVGAPVKSLECPSPGAPHAPAGESRFYQLDPRSARPATLPARSEPALGERAEERLEVDVAAGEDDADPEPSHVDPAVEDRRERDGARRLDDDLEPFPGE